MKCKNPFPLYDTTDGTSKTLHYKQATKDSHTEVSCGSCMPCRINRQREWSTRLMHETGGYRAGESWFITLTYAPEYLPPGGSLEYADVQKFLKRLRYKHGKVRYYCCCEYGDDPDGILNPFTGQLQLGRPHYHLIVWGLELNDYEEKGVARKYGFSQTIQDLWPMGQTTTDEVTPKRINYCAGYVLKKMYGVAAEQHYQKLDPATGQIYPVEPETSKMSLRPGIGYRFVKNDWNEASQGDFETDLLKGFVTDGKGRRMPVPKTYKRWLSQTHRHDSVDAINLKQRRSSEEIEAQLANVPDDLRRLREAAAEHIRERRYNDARRLKDL